MMDKTTAIGQRELQHHNPKKNKPIPGQCEKHTGVSNSLLAVWVANRKPPQVATSIKSVQQYSTLSMCSDMVCQDENQMELREAGRKKYGTHLLNTMSSSKWICTQNRVFVVRYFIQKALDLTQFTERAGALQRRSMKYLQPQHNQTSSCKARIEGCCEITCRHNVKTCVPCYRGIGACCWELQREQRKGRGLRGDGWTVKYRMRNKNRICTITFLL